jgi:SAM-dependent methyltransferase
MNILHSGLRSIYTMLLPVSVREAVYRAPMLRRIVTSGQKILLGHHQYMYNPTYYMHVDYDAMRSRDAMADSIVADLNPQTLVDVGCGTGALLEAICQRGVSAEGLEYADAGRAMCQKRGLKVRRFNILTDPIPQDVQGKGVAMSFEVAEHLPESGADKFVDLLCAFSNVVVCSAATPGQGGTEHINEQPHEYWIDKFRARGFEFDRALSETWRSTWESKKVARFYSANVMVFRKQSEF